MPQHHHNAGGAEFADGGGIRFILVYDFAAGGVVFGLCVYGAEGLGYACAGGAEACAGAPT